jgi:hypothetical protein
MRYPHFLLLPGNRSNACLRKRSQFPQGLRASSSLRVTGTHEKPTKKKLKNSEVTWARKRYGKEEKNTAPANPSPGWPAQAALREF